jgi:hypothetical protein
MRAAPAANARQHFLVENGAVDLIRRQPRLVSPADLARFIERLHIVVAEPETHSLLHQVFIIKMLGHAEHPSQKVRADLDRGLANAPREALRFFDDQDANAGVLPEQQCRRGSAGQRAADDHDIVSRVLPGGRCVHICHGSLHNRCATGCSSKTPAASRRKKRIAIAFLPRNRC